MKIAEIETSIADTIRENCSLILSSGIPLYRGVDKKPDEFVGTIRSDRKPLSSSPAQSKLFDLIMEQLGLPFRKSNTLSVTIDRPQAAVYSQFNNIYRIFPFDDATYLASKDHGDLIFFASSVLNKFMKHLLDNKLHDGKPHDLRHILRQDLLSNSRYDDEFKHWVSQQDYSSVFVTGKNISKVANNAVGEILVLGTSYVAVTDRPPGHVDNIIG